MSSDDLVVDEMSPGYHLLNLPPGVEFVSMNPDLLWADLAVGRCPPAYAWGPELLDAVDFLVWCDNASVEALEKFAVQNPAVLHKKALHYK